ncbi:MAG: TOBE domain-containing protein, partial [Deltaproteobacteria bacterium]|nr:TOBE domain-containing protein [Deltaproteobacteria bacterium]
FIDVELVDDGDRRLLKSEGVEIELEDRLKHRFDSLAQRRVVLGVRPQSLYAAADDKQALILGTVETVEPYGPETYIRLALGGQQISSRLEATDNPVKGEVFALAATADSFYFFDPHTGSAIY